MTVIVQSTLPQKLQTDLCRLISSSENHELHLNANMLDLKKKWIAQKWIIQKDEKIGMKMEERKNERGGDKKNARQ